VIEPAPGAVAGPDLADDILRFAAAQMARFKRPRALDFRAVPHTDTGKVNRTLLREELLGGAIR
jgi:acyl-CoA synthetase (AMP-forming)/AMP-acid ligase II